MEKKVTKKDNYNMLAELVEKSNVANKTELLGFIDHEIELLEKKSSKNTMTATQKANLEVIETIKEVLRDNGEPMTVSEMLKDNRLSAYTNQKISALLRQLGENGTKEVVKVIDKKISRFTLAE